MLCMVKKKVAEEDELLMFVFVDICVEEKRNWDGKEEDDKTFFWNEESFPAIFSIAMFKEVKVGDCFDLWWNIPLLKKS